MTALKAQNVHGDKKIEDNQKKGDLAKHSIYYELMGNGLISTVNYDYRFGDEVEGVGFSIGAGGFSYRNVQLVTTPVMVNYLLGGEGHYFEMGLGGSYYGGNQQFFFVDNSNSLMGTATIGYRVQPPEGGFFFRVNMTPTFGNFGDDPDCRSSNCDDRQFVFWPFYGGISFGVTF